MSQNYILAYLNKNKNDIKKKYGISKIGLLGSYARGEATEKSDIDIVIEIDKDRKNIHTFLAFKRELEAQFGKEVDLGLESSIKPIIREAIQKEILYV